MVKQCILWFAIVHWSENNTNKLRPNRNRNTDYNIYFVTFGYVIIQYAHGTAYFHLHLLQLPCDWLALQELFSSILLQCYPLLYGISLSELQGLPHGTAVCGPQTPVTTARVTVVWLAHEHNFHRKMTQCSI